MKNFLFFKKQILYQSRRIGAENMYKLWKRKELGLDDDKHWEVDINKNMGLVGKVSEMRKKLEDLWKKEI